LWNSFNASILWRFRAMYFYSWGVPGNLRNREVRTRWKRGL